MYEATPSFTHKISICKTLPSEGMGRLYLRTQMLSRRGNPPRGVQGGLPPWRCPSAREDAAPHTKIDSLRSPLFISKIGASNSQPLQRYLRLKLATTNVRMYLHVPWTTWNALSKCH